MDDRIPTPGLEGRVKITKEDGTSFLAFLEMADNPSNPGTPLNKSTLLKDQTAALFGLLEDAVPDDVYAWLGKYNQHWWRRQAVTALYGYSEVQTQATKNGQYVFYNVAGNIQYSSSITINQTTGAISLVNPQSVYVSRDQVKTADQVNSITALLDGKYVTGLSEMDDKANYPRTSNVFYVPSGTKWDKNYSDDLGYYYAVYPFGNRGYYINLVTTQIYRKPAGAVSYVYSANRNTYPDSGTSSGYNWEYLGVPFEKLVTASAIETSTYVGTGLFGSANPNTLTFTKPPKMVLVSLFNAKDLLYAFVRGVTTYSMIATSTSVWGSTVASWSGNTLSWYFTGGMDTNSQNLICQANVAGTTYNVVAFF